MDVSLNNVFRYILDIYRIFRYIYSNVVVYFLVIVSKLIE